METIKIPADLSPTLQKAMVKAISLEEYEAKIAKSIGNNPTKSVNNDALKSGSKLSPNFKKILVGSAILIGIYGTYKFYQSWQARNTKPAEAEKQAAAETPLNDPLQDSLNDNQENHLNSNSSPQHPDKNSLESVYAPYVIAT
jgi:hypothetical protein